MGDEFASDAKEATKTVMDGTPKALAGVFAGSLMVLAKAAKHCDDFGSSNCKDYEGWAVACSVIGLAMAIVMIILLALMPDFKKDTPYLVMVFFLAALWIAGVGTMTFKRPYKDTADNGYFGAWIAVLSAVALLSEALKGIMDSIETKMHSAEAFNWWFQLFAASLVAMIQASINCDEAKDCEDELAWAVAAGTVSFVVVLVMLIIVCVMEKDDGANIFYYMSAGLVIWWVAGVGVSTYKDGPFTKMGNGYFSFWLALFSSAKLFEAVKGEGKSAGAGTGYMAALFFTSVACMIAASIVCDDNNECKEYEAWAVAASATSAIITLVLLIWGTFFTEGTDSIFNLVMIICSAVLLAVWIVGTYTMTFKRPFKMERGNGYFGAWLSLILAWWSWTSVCPGVKEAMEKLDQYGGWAYQVLAIASVIEGLQAAHDCHDQDCDENHLGYAVAAGWVSFTVVLVVYILTGLDCWNRTGAIIAAGFLTIWWTFAAGTLTYDKPYLTFGNAYVGIWIATICSWLILTDVLLKDDAPAATEEQAVEGSNEPAAPEAEAEQENPPVRQEDAE